jgi:flavodoxin I
MKALVVYDSQFGNTEKIAQAISQELSSRMDIEILQVGNVKPELLAGISFLVVGSPTQRFRPTTATTNFLKSIPKNGLDRIKVAAFDTRLTEKEIGENRILAFFVSLYGYAAEPISKILQRKGGTLIVPPEGFFVEGMEGPLIQGELERASDWAKQFIATQ